MSDTKQLPMIFYKRRIRKRPPKYVIIHSTLCSVRNAPNSLKLDQDKKFQLPELMFQLVKIQKMEDCPFHYIIEMVNNDFYVFNMLPVHYASPFYDQEFDLNESMIHIGITGNFNIEFAIPRLYEILAYRLLTPLLNTWYIPYANIKLHSELVPQAKCPGDMFYKEVMITKLKKYFELNKIK
jgi:hypothetical protein